MGKYYLAERLKNRHTSVGKLILLMPVAAVCLAAWLTMEYFTIDSYNWWYMFLFPGMTAVICAVAGGLDKKMGDRAGLALPVDMGAVWDAKVLYGFRCMGISLLVFLTVTLLTGTGLAQIFQYHFQMNPSVSGQILAVAVLYVTSLWQIPVCLLLQQKLGMFPMLLIHMGSYCLGAAELSLHACFMLLPGGIAARMMCIILKILPNGLTAEPGSLTFSPELLERKGLLAGIVASLLWLALFWFAGRRWFERKTEK